MKRLVYGALVAAALMVPTAPQELGKLIPVEVIKIGQADGTVLIETDTGDAGRGATVEAALRDLSATAPGTIYLDTAEYVLIPEGEKELLGPLTGSLKESVKLCCWEGTINMEEVAVFLDAHTPGTNLKEYQKGMPLQTLAAENGRLKLKEKTVKNQ